MSKIVLTDTAGGYNLSAINSNLQTIATHLNDKVFYRDNPVGEPNQLSSTVDFNNQDGLNVKDFYINGELFVDGLKLSEAIDQAAGGLTGEAADFAAAAALSAAQADASKTAAAGSANAAAASYDSFDDRYLGPKATPPTLDNDGQPLLIGALYWDTTLSPGGTFPATSITVTPAGNIGSTTVQAALQELDTEKAKLNGDAAVAFASSAFTGPLTGATTGAHNGTVGATTPNTGTFTTLNFAGGTTTSTFTLQYPTAATQRALAWNNNGLNRWTVLNDGVAESGSNVGSNLIISRFSDAGAFIDNPFQITRSSGATTVASLVATSTITPSQTAGLVGTTTNNNANAGSVGEYATVTSGNVGLSSGVTANITSLSLTAGDWDVSGNILYSSGTGTTITGILAAVNVVSATFPANPFYSQLTGISIGSTLSGSQVAPETRLSLSGTTTIYCVGNASFSGGTATAVGYIRARRVR